MKPTTTIRTIVADGAWTWFNDERAIWDGARLYVGYVRRDGTVAATCFSAATGTSVEVPLSSWRERDDHNNPAFWMRPDGRLLVAYATHGSRSSWWYRVLKDPYFPQEWGPETKVELGKFRKGWTYCNLYYAAGSLFNFGRAIDWNPTLCIKGVDGETWGAPLQFIKSRDRPYFKCTAGSGERIDIAYTDGHPRTTKNSIYHVFLQHGVWYGTDGCRLASLEDLPIDANRGTVVYPFASGYQGPAWIWDVQTAAGGSPVIVFSVSATVKKDDFRYCYATWSAGELLWSVREIARAGAGLYKQEQDYVGGIVIDKKDVSIVYCSTAIDPVSGRVTPHREIYMGKVLPDGCKWQAVTADSNEDNLRPFVPIGGERSVLWMQGRYRSYRDFDCKILLLCY